MRVLHITPGLPPAPEALGDYAVLLGRRLREVSAGRVESWHVAAGQRSLARLDDESHVNATGEPDPDALVRTVRSSLADAPAAVLLHYVGYGYAGRGAPFWLLRAMRRLVRERPDTRLVTVFHELYARGKPWQSSFWMAPAQRHVAASLARLGHGAFTNRQVAARWLRGVRGRRPSESVAFSPTFSNVGEPGSVPAWSDREPVAVVFGGVGTRARAFAAREPGVARTLDALEIEAVWEIGPPRSDGRDFHGRPVDELGLLPADQVSERLLRSRVGFLHYPLGFLTKSGVAAAYLAHGVAPVVLDAGDPVPDLEEGEVYLIPGPVTSDFAARCGRRGFTWYRDHARSELAAQRILPLLAGVGERSPDPVPAEEDL